MVAQVVALLLEVVHPLQVEAEPQLPVHSRKTDTQSAGITTAATSVAAVFILLTSAKHSAKRRRTSAAERAEIKEAI